MNRLWILSSTLLRNNLNISWKTKKGRRNLLLYIVMLVCMTPLAIMLGFGAFSLFNLGLTRQTVFFYTLLQCVFNLLMIGISFPPVFYFSNDNETLLSLPLRPFDIVGAKTLVVLSSQMYMILVTCVPLVAAFCLSSAFSWAGLIILIIAQVLSVLILFMALGTIWIAVFALFPKAVNKDRFTLLSGILGVAFSIGISVMMQTSHPGETVDPTQMGSLMQGFEQSFGFLGWLFPQAPLSADAVAAGSLSSLLLLIGLFFLLLALFIWASRTWYLGSAAAAAEASPRRSRGRRKEIGRQAAWKSYLVNEVHLLLRTPAASFNIVLGSFIIPIMLILILGIQAKELRPMLDEIVMHNGEPGFPDFPAWALMLTIGLFLTVFVAGTSTASSTVISRMGVRGLDWMKTIPMSLARQAQLKMIPGIVLSLIASQLTVICLHMLVSYPYWLDLLYLAGNLIGSLLINEIALITDLLHPKLGWDSETEAIKNNMNTLIDLGLAVVILLLILAVYFILPFGWAALCSAVLLIVICALFWRLIEKKAAAWLLKAD